MAFKDEFYNLLDGFNSSPFLFIGSGFSFRYLNTEKWEDLLNKFSQMMDKPFEKYKSFANSNWPLVGSNIAQDFHAFWFESEQTKELMTATKQEMISIASPLKVAIADYLIKKSEFPQKENLVEELELLKAAKIDGIITTNYDLLLEKIFPSFKVYKSQQELIFSNIQEVGEIYKIHGCASDPNSIVLTDEDYKAFDNKNAYLAAKLLTIFLEHPTIFIGYSISDTNVRAILTSIMTCLNQTQIIEISKRIIFVNYNPAHNDEPLIQKHDLEIGGSILPLTRIIASDFREIFFVLSQLHQKYPASILRRMKEHIYELVKTNDPTEKIAVVDFNDETDLENVNVVIGVGVTPQGVDKAYDSYSRIDIADDILNDNRDFNIGELCAKTLPKIIKSATWTPVCKYLSKLSDLEGIDLKLVSAYNRSFDDWKNATPAKVLAVNQAHDTIASITKDNAPEKAVLLIPLLDIEKINPDELREFLLLNSEMLKKPTYSSYYMKLVCLLDRMENFKNFTG